MILDYNGEKRGFIMTRQTLKTLGTEYRTNMNIKDLKSGKKAMNQAIKRLKKSDLEHKIPMIKEFKEAKDSFKSGLKDNDLGAKEQMDLVNLIMGSLELDSKTQYGMKLFEDQQVVIDRDSAGELVDGIIADYDDPVGFLDTKGRLDHEALAKKHGIELGLDLDDGTYALAGKEDTKVDVDFTPGEVKFENKKLSIENIQDLKPRKLIKQLKNEGIEADKGDMKKIKKLLKKDKFEKLEKVMERRLKDDGVKKVNINIDEVQTGTESVQNGYQTVANDPMDINSRPFVEDISGQLAERKAWMDERGLKYDAADFEKVKAGEMTLAELDAKLEAMNPDSAHEYANFASEMITETKPGQYTEGNGKQSAALLDPEWLDGDAVDAKKLFENHVGGKLHGSKDYHFLGDMKLAETDGLKFYGHSEGSPNNKSFIANGKIALANGHHIEYRKDGNVAVDGKVLDEGEKINLGKDSTGQDIILETFSGIDKQGRKVNGETFKNVDAGTNFKLTAGELEIKSRIDLDKGDKMWGFLTTKIKDNGIADSGIMINMMDGKANTEADLKKMGDNNYINDLNGWINGPFQTTAGETINKYRLGQEYFKEEPTYTEVPVTEQQVDMNLTARVIKEIIGANWMAKINQILQFSEYNANNQS